MPLAALFSPDPSDRTCNGLFAAVGKTLALATLFEANCRALATNLSLHESLPLILAERSESLTKTVFADFVKAILDRQRRLSANVQFIHGRIDDAEIYRILDEAREARNSAAHESALMFESWYTDPESMNRAFSDLRRLVAKLSLGLRLVSLMIPMLKVPPEPPPPSQIFNGLPALYEEWVFGGVARSMRSRG